MKGLSNMQLSELYDVAHSYVAAQDIKLDFGFDRQPNLSLTSLYYGKSDNLQNQCVKRVSNTTLDLSTGWRESFIDQYMRQGAAKKLV